MNPLLSIVIPAHNRINFLQEAIESALRQVNVSLEVIVVDDGSTDGTGEILKSLGYPIRYFYQENQGPSSARNVGLWNARSKYIIFLDSDDLIFPQKSSIQLAIMEANPDISVVYSRWKTVRMGGQEIRTVGIDHTPDVLPTLLYKNIALPNACLFRTDAVREIGGFDEKLKGIEDWDLLLRLAIREKVFAFSPEVTAVYRLHSNNLSFHRQLMLKNALLLVDKMFSSNKLPKRYKDCYEHVRCIQYLETIERCFKNKEHILGRKYLQEMLASISVDPKRIHLHLLDQLQYKSIWRKTGNNINLPLEVILNDIRQLQDVLVEYVHCA